jgi:cell wall-associated NlpC family hydrolase
LVISLFRGRLDGRRCFLLLLAVSAGSSDFPWRLVDDLMEALVNKIKVQGRPKPGLAVLVLVLSLPLAACLPATARESARPPAPAAFAPAEFPEAPAFAPRPSPAPAEAGLDLAETGRKAWAPASAAIGRPPAIPAAAPRPSIFAGGLIDRDRLLAESFPDPLATALAGEGLLLAHGLTPSLREDAPDPLAAAPRFPRPEAAAAPSAPSAGEPLLAGGRAAWYGTGRIKTGQADGLTRHLLTSAYEQTGRHYKLGGFSPVAGFDAPGYTRWVFAREGLTLPNTPAALAAAGTEVAREDLRPGDVLIYRNPIDQVNGWHVGIYSGQGNFLHASPKAGVVTETDAFGPQYAPYFLGGRRFFDDPAAAPLSDDQKMAATSTAVKLALAELGPNDRLVKPAPHRPKSKAKRHKAAKK